LPVYWIDEFWQGGRHVLGRSILSNFRDCECPCSDLEKTPPEPATPATQESCPAPRVMGNSQPVGQVGEEAAAVKI
jgi:hypothetical protein